MYLKKLSLIFLSNVWSSSLINRRKKWLECKNPLNMVKQVKLFVNKLSARSISWWFEKNLYNISVW